MGQGWHSAAAMKQWATVLLALALAGIAATYTANNRSVQVQGPGALQAVDERTVWLGVNEELWVLDREGRRTAQRTARELGFTEGISNIVLAPDGQALLTSRGDLHWQVVDRATLGRVRTIIPHWPAGFADNYLRAIHLAIAPGGDIAVATGGGHAVLLFDREGRYKTRTAPGTYRFTNGLWWSPEGWWTTDTNRFALHLLDATTLAVKKTVQLQAAPASHPYLGEAMASQAQPAPGGGYPLATVSRLGRLMEPGYVVDVFADGSQLAYNRHPIGQLRDMAWFDNRLLVVDGESFTVLRFGADRLTEEPFGDRSVRAQLRQMHEDRAFWRSLGSRYALTLAVVLLLAGVAAYARHRQLAAQAVVAAREGGADAPRAVPPRELARQRLRVYGIPIAVRIAVFAVTGFVVFPLLHDALLGPTVADLASSLRLLVLSVVAPLLLVALWQHWRHERLSARPEFEAALNHRAIAWLQSHDDFDRVKLQGEVARETVYVQGWRPRWLLVTNRRVLLFLASGTERRLVSEWSRRAVTHAGAPSDAPDAPPPSLVDRLRPPNLLLRFTSGTTLRLRCASNATAQRVAQVLMTSPALPEDGEAPLPPPAPAVRRRWHEVLASLIVPGTGQWLQGRFATGTLLFAAAVTLAIYGWWPVVWALHGPKMEVPALTIVFAGLSWLLLALAACSDALAFSGTRRAR